MNAIKVKDVERMLRVFSARSGRRPPLDGSLSFRVTEESEGFFSVYAYWVPPPYDFRRVRQARTGVRTAGTCFAEDVAGEIDGAWRHLHGQLFPRPLPTFRIRRDGRRLATRATR